MVLATEFLARLQIPTPKIKRVSRPDSVLIHKIKTDPPLIDDAPPVDTRKIKEVEVALVADAALLYDTELSRRFDCLERRSDAIEVFGRDAEGEASIAVYQAKYKLASAGMAEVTLAVDASERFVVIKELIPVYYSDAEALAGLRREAAIAALALHPALLPVIGFHNISNRCQLVFPFVKGPTLTELIRLSLRVSPEFALVIICNLLEVCVLLNQHKILHRDLKPDNVLINIEERGSLLTLLDFGVARMGESIELEKASSVWGNEYYLAPEIKKFGSCAASSVQSELFSIGVILRDLLRKVQVPQDIKLFIDSLTKHNPKERPASFEVALAKARRLIFLFAG